MNIELKKVSVRDLVQNYKNNAEEGVFGFNNKLNIRPKYQREFIYKKEQQEAVIETIEKGFPLNVIYWANNGDGTYELLDGQQRTLSICSYVNGGFAKNYRFFHNLDDTEKARILDYELMVYVCSGDETEKLEWFKTINISGEKLTQQELRNAVYTGTWLSSAKSYFSKTKCPAYDMAKEYMKGSPIRQDYLETALKWISNNNIEEYMALHQKDKNATPLWLYYQRVINWFKAIFPNYRKEMKGLPLGELYNKYGQIDYDSGLFEDEVKRLLIDDEVTNNKGIYQYLLTGVEKYLSIRTFSHTQKRKAYEKQNGICTICGGHFEINEMEADHITPWSDGGKTSDENCQMLCKSCNRKKSNK